MRWLILLGIFVGCFGVGVGLWQISHPKMRYRAEGLFSNSTTVTTDFKVVKGKKSVEIIELDSTIDSAALSLVKAGLKQAKDQSVDSVLVILDTPGGDVESGVKIAKLIENSEIPVNCLVDTRALSMGFYILQSCRVRAISVRAFLMAHQPSVNISGGFGGKAAEWRSIEQNLEAVGEGMANYEARRLKISEDEFKKRIENKDYYMNYRQALEVGAVDLVIEDTREKMYTQQIAGYEVHPDTIQSLP